MPDQGDHWDFLAADLGASPPPKEEPKQEEPESLEPSVEADVVKESCGEVAASDVDDQAEEVLAAEDQPDASPEKPRKPQPGRKGDRVVSGFGHRRGTVDWANLARELGVEAMEEAPDPIPAAETTAESEVTAIFDREPVELAPEQAEALDLPAWQAEPIDLAPRQAEPVGGGFGAGIVDDASSESAHRTPEEGADADETQEERKGRRRRRRRKPKRSESTEEQPVDAVIIIDEEGEAEAKSPPQQEEEEETDRPRHRGRRRGNRKRGPREGVTAEPKQFGAGVARDESDLDDDDDEFEIFDANDDLDDEDDESTDMQGDEHSTDHGQERKSKKVTHRGIPSWDEAVGHIIDSNMEDRSKRPDSGNSRQRPGRRRGGDRSGNRGRS